MLCSLRIENRISCRTNNGGTPEKKEDDSGYKCIRNLRKTMSQNCSDIKVVTDGK